MAARPPQAEFRPRKEAATSILPTPYQKHQYRIGTALNRRRPSPKNLRARYHQTASPQEPQTPLPADSARIGHPQQTPPLGHRASLTKPSPPTKPTRPTSPPEETCAPHDPAPMPSPPPASPHTTPAPALHADRPHEIRSRSMPKPSTPPHQLRIDPPPPKSPHQTAQTARNTASAPKCNPHPATSPTPNPQAQPSPTPQSPTTLPKSLSSSLPVSK